MFFSRVYNLFFFLCLLASCGTSQEKRSSSAQLKMEIGVSYIHANNLPLALKELLVAEQLDPRNYLVHNNLGLVYFLRQKYDLSIKHYTTAFTIEPNFTEAKNNLARVYIEIKQYRQAEKLLNAVLDDLTYTNANAAYMNYGLLRFNQKKFQEAKSYFLRVVKTKRDDCYGQVYLGRSYLELGQNKLASEQLDKATEFCLPLLVDDAHYFGAIAYYRQGIRDKSLARFQEVSTLYPDGNNKENAQKMIQLIQKGQ